MTSTDHAPSAAMPGRLSSRPREFNEIHDLIANVRFGIQMLQSSEHRNDLVATFDIQRNLIIPLRIQSSLV